MNKGNIIIYQSEDGTTSLEVKLKQETVWLDTHQMALLFGRDRSVISKHISNVYKAKELDQKLTSSKSPKVAKDGKVRYMHIYNLDVIIAVGYRVNSERGTQFRVWATNVLRNHLVAGYTLNKKRLEEKTDKQKNLQQQVQLLKESTANSMVLPEPEIIKLLAVSYKSGFDLLDQYEKGKIKAKAKSKQVEEVFVPDYASVQEAVLQLKTQLKKPVAYGKEKEESLKILLDQLNQEETSYTVEEKAAHLLIGILKDLPFEAGNQQIGGLLFLWYLEKNHLLHDNNGTKKIDKSLLIVLIVLIEQAAEPRALIPLIKALL